MIPSSDLDVLRFWGKARPLTPDRGAPWHPLPFHCLDVAATAEAFLAKQEPLCDRLAGLLGWSRAETVRVVTFLIGLHDIGKFAKRFQVKHRELYKELGRFPDDPSRLGVSFDHGAGGLRLFDVNSEWFRLPKGPSWRIWRPLVSAVTGHHGSPPKGMMSESEVALRVDFGASGIKAACEFVQHAYRLLSPPTKLEKPDRQSERSASFALAGLAVLADWIGSNQEWFPYRAPDEFQDLEAYWAHARSQAERAVHEAGVLPADSCDRLDYDGLLRERAVPSPMQDWAHSVEIPSGPALFLIEDETGSGKTEAALMLVHRLMAAGRAEGLYMALPTMATANAMYERLAERHRRLFATDAYPSLVLVHGARDLHKGFRSVGTLGAREEQAYATETGDESDRTASAECAAWIADDRRRSFLADVGAGTVDQALLSILPSRHQSLRLLGLMGRVLVVDEVHAYDAYMQREIETLLTFQAGLGGSAILLSATLPLAVRERLANAFAQGLGEPREDLWDDEQVMEYPLATVCTRGARRLSKVSGRPGRARSLPIRFLRSADGALDNVEKAARADQAVVYVRNTVGDALEAYDKLRSRDLDTRRLRLFHARFALGDRLEIERGVLSTFGEKSKPAERAGQVLIATQVVEQSLDLDFDVAISDLAPVDLLIQRAGRLWRHERDRRGAPELCVVSPLATLKADADWFGSMFPRAAYVYKDHARLWLTAKVLEDRGCIESPGCLRELIEAVYGGEAEENLPSGLQNLLFDAEGRSGAERSVATTNALKLDQGYVRDGGAWDSDLRTPTRIADVPPDNASARADRRGTDRPVCRRYRGLARLAAQRSPGGSEASGRRLRPFGSLAGCPRGSRNLEALRR